MLDSTSDSVETRSKHWAFTFSDYTKYQIEEIEEILESNICSKYIFGEKTIDPPGIPHINGYVLFKTAKNLSNIKKIFRLNMQWKKVTNIKACIRSCVDCGKYKLKNIKSYEMRDSQDIAPQIVKYDILDEEDLRDWQKDLIKIINNPADNRTIHWYWDPNGCTGKSVFAKYLHRLYNACVVHDCEFETVVSRVYAHNNCDLVVIDIPRSTRDYISYTVLDYIKNGILVDPENDSRTKAIPSPHVIVFSNYEPSRERLSIDRWNVVKL
jgi:hypothetical protein